MKVGDDCFQVISLGRSLMFSECDECDELVTGSAAMKLRDGY